MGTGWHLVLSDLTKTQVQGQLILTAQEKPGECGHPVMKKPRSDVLLDDKAREEQLTCGAISVLLQLEGALPTQTNSQISGLVYISGPAKPDRVVHSRIAVQILGFNQMSTSMWS